MGVDLETYRGRIGNFGSGNGIDVVTLTYVVNFNGGIRVTGSVLFIGLLLLMAGIESNPGPPTKCEKQRTVRLTGIPYGVDKEFLRLFFKNRKRQGGGKIEEITFDEESRSAYIIFEDPEAVKLVLQKRPVKIKDTIVQVSAFPEHMPTGQRMSLSTVEVTGFQQDGSVKELLQLYFEDEESSGGGDVVDINVVEDRKALVTFDSSEVAERVIKRKIHTLQNKPLTIVAYNEEDAMKHLACCDASTEEVNHSEERRTIRVTGIPDGVDKEFLRLFFKNRRKKGGGNIEEITFDEDNRTAYILFQDPEAVKIILQKRPIKIKETVVQVFAFHEHLPSEQRVSVSTIEVTGFQQDSSAKELLQLYFEDEESSGGGDVIHINIIEDRKALITFDSAEVAQRVINRKEHSLQKKTLTIVASNEEVAIKHLACCDSSTDSLEIFSGAKQFQMDVDTQKISVDVVKHKEHECASDCADRLVTDDRGEVFRQLLLKLGLTNQYPGKMSLEDVTAIDPNEVNYLSKKCDSLVDVPWMMIRRLIYTDSEFMDACNINKSGNDKDLKDTVFFISDLHEDSEIISPLDIFAVVFQCCDPLLKQLLVQKLYLCKLAVPFLFKQWESNESIYPTVYVWPLRSLVIENKMQSTIGFSKSEKVDVFELKTKALAFARIGRPSYSKSKLINNFLSKQNSNTFFNIESPSGMSPRHLYNGNIELFWLPTIGDENDRFQDDMTFFNMRGDLNGDFDKSVQTFISNFVDAVIVFVDREILMKHKKETESIIVKFSSVILVITDPLRSDLVKQIKEFEHVVTALKRDIKLRIISTHNGVVEKNIIDMVSYMSMHISSHLKSSHAKSFEERLSGSRIDKLKTDEQEKYCEKGRKEAAKIFQQMKQDGESRQWKYLLTPVYSKYSQKLGQLMKQRERVKDLLAIENCNSEIRLVHHQQTLSITNTVKSFIDILIRTGKCSLQVKLFLSWLHFYIEREKRTILPDLMYESRCAWEKLKTLKSKETKDPSEIENQETAITELEVKIDEASFSIDHFFREIGHIYEAILELKETPSKFDLPPVEKIANIIGKLVASGHQFELIDGESFYMPYLWTRLVLTHVDYTIKSSKVMSVSVHGLQNSGKSTLLNTMFGCQFSTRAERCTRGIHLKLIPIKAECLGSTVSPFRYVLVIDTEGLRSPELSNYQHEHDNELATMITGIGDITLVNIMGENTSEIRDILQVIVHAFIRLKMANRKLNIRKSCFLIHQNVTDTSASENMLSGLSKLMQTLDEMTRESAHREGILDISTFNQIFEFDINSQVWYLKNLWQGNPPMARVNIGYIEKVVEIKCKIIQKAKKMENKSYKSVIDIIDHAHSLWKGVLNENFLRNCLEIKAYIEMEKKIQDEIWQLETFVRDSLIFTAQNAFEDCLHAEKLRGIADDVIDRLNNLLADKKAETETVIRIFFENHKYKDIMIQWIEGQYRLITDVCEKLERHISKEVEKSLQKRSLKILTVADHERHEEELRRRSMLVAHQFKGKELTENEKDRLFADIWQSFLNKVGISSYYAEKRKNMREVFLTYLKKKFEKHTALLKESLEKTKYLQPVEDLKKLSDSFNLTGISKDDISFTLFPTVKDLLRKRPALQLIGERVNQILEAMDGEIQRLYQVNEEITELNVHRLMHDLDDSIKDILTGTAEYDFKKTFYVKLCVHVSRFAHPVFEQHNEEYFKTHGLAVCLEQYRKQQLISFKGYFKKS